MLRLLEPYSNTKWSKYDMHLWNTSSFCTLAMIIDVLINKFEINTPIEIWKLGNKKLIKKKWLELSLPIQFNKACAWIIDPTILLYERVGYGFWRIRCYAVFPDISILQVLHYLPNTVVAFKTCSKTDHQNSIPLLESLLCFHVT